VIIKFIVKFSFSPPTYYFQLVNFAILYMFTLESTILKVCYYFKLMIFCFIFKKNINIIESMYQKITHYNPLYWCEKAYYVQLCCIYFDYLHCVDLFWFYPLSFKTLWYTYNAYRMCFQHFITLDKILMYSCLCIICLVLKLFYSILNFNKWSLGMVKLIP